MCLSRWVWRRSPWANSIDRTTEVSAWAAKWCRGMQRPERRLQLPPLSASPESLAKRIRRISTAIRTGLGAGKDGKFSLTNKHCSLSLSLSFPSLNGLFFWARFQGSTDNDQLREMAPTAVDHQRCGGSEPFPVRFNLPRPPDGILASALRVQRHQ